MANRMSASELRAARLDIKARLRSGEDVSVAEKKAVGYGGWGRYATTQAINVGGTRDIKVAESMVAAGQDSQAVSFLRGEGYSARDVGTVIAPPTRRDKTTASRRDKTTASLATKQYDPRSSPFHPDYVAPSQPKSYYIPEEERIQTFSSGGRIVGLVDPGAGMSMAAPEGSEFLASDIAAEEQRRAMAKLWFGFEQVQMQKNGMQQNVDMPKPDVGMGFGGGKGGARTYVSKYNMLEKAPGYKEYVKEKGVLSGTQQFLMVEAQKMKFSKGSGVGSRVFSIPTEVAGDILGTAAFGVNVATKPGKTATNLAGAVVAVAKDPYKLGYGVGGVLKEAQRDPLRVSSFVISSYLTDKALGALAKKSPIKFEIVNTKLVGSSDEVAASYRGLGIKIGKESRIYSGLIDDAGGMRLQMGGGFDLTDLSLSGAYEPATATELALVRKSKGITDDVAKLESGFDIMKQTERTKSAFVSNKLPKKTETLSEEGINLVQKELKKKGGKIEVFGSYPSQSQIPDDLWGKYRGGDIPGDVDIQLKSMVPGDAETFASYLAGKLSKIEKKTVRVNPTMPGLVEVEIVPGQWAHALDIHSYADEIGTASGSTFGGLDKIQSPLFGGTPIKGGGVQFNKKIGGVKSTTLSEQGIRKGAGSLQLRTIDSSYLDTATEKLGESTVNLLGLKEGQIRILPEAHRFKDVSDFAMVSDTLGKSKVFGGGKVSQNLDEFVSLYPKEIIYPKQDQATQVLLASKSYNIPSTVSKVSPRVVSVGLGMVGSTSSLSSTMKVSQTLSMPVSMPKTLPSISIGKIRSVPSISNKPSRSPSSFSLSTSVSPRMSVSSSVMPSKSPSMSVSPSMSISPSFSPSPISRSTSPSMSVSLMPSRSPRPIRSVSPYLSPRPSRSPSPSPSPLPRPSPPPPILIPDFDFNEQKKKQPKSKAYSLRPKTKYTPSLEASFFGIRGKAVKNITGLELRPISA